MNQQKHFRLLRAILHANMAAQTGVDLYRSQLHASKLRQNRNILTDVELDTLPDRTAQVFKHMSRRKRQLHNI